MQITKNRIIQKSYWIFPFFFFASLGFLKLANINWAFLISVSISVPLTISVAFLLNLLKEIRTPESETFLGNTEPLLTKLIGFHAGKGRKSFYVRGPLAKLHLFADHMVIDASPMWHFKVTYSELIEFEKQFSGIKLHHRNKKMPQDFYITSGFGVKNAIADTSKRHNLGLKVV